jgi:hypothetical protein
MPYVAQRKFVMFGQGFAQPGNAYDLPHIIPAELIERMPHRSLANLVARRMVVQVEANSITAAVIQPAVAAAVPTDIEDSRVSKEGHGWYLVDGKRVHGRKGVERALTELGG